MSPLQKEPQFAFFICFARSQNVLEQTHTAKNRKDRSLNSDVWNYCCYIYSLASVNYSYSYTKCLGRGYRVQWCVCVCGGGRGDEESSWNSSDTSFLHSHEDTFTISTGTFASPHVCARGSHFPRCSYVFSFSFVLSFCLSFTSISSFLPLFLSRPRSEFSMCVRACVCVPLFVTANQ